MQLVIFVGLPGSGKSTYYQREFSSTHTLVSKDLMSPNNRRKGARQNQQIVQSLREGRSVVVDNTNPTRADRQELVELGRALGARVVCVYFPLPASECVARNAARERRVPNVAIFAIAKKLEPPSVEEGFDELLVIGS